MMQPVAKGYKPWIVASLSVLVLSLILLATDVTAAFIGFGKQTPLWVVVVGAAALFGVLLGFGGFLVLMTVAGWLSFREQRRVQIIPPEHPAKDAG